MLNILDCIEVSCFMVPKLSGNSSKKTYINLKVNELLTTCAWQVQYLKVVVLVKFHQNITLYAINNN